MATTGRIAGQAKERSDRSKSSIKDLPPLNGFVSEWLRFQATLGSPQLPQWGLKLTVPAAGFHGYVPVNAPDLRGWLDHGQWGTGATGRARSSFPANTSPGYRRQPRPPCGR